MRRVAQNLIGELWVVVSHSPRAPLPLDKRLPLTILRSTMNTSRVLSRRRFLRRTTAAVGAAVLAPSIVPAAVLGRNGAVSPSERITMGFIGVGGQGGGHLLGGAWTYVAGGYAGRKDVQVLAVCDVWRERCERARQRVNDHYSEVYSKTGYKSCEA